MLRKASPKFRAHSIRHWSFSSDSSLWGPFFGIFKFGIFRGHHFL